MGIWGPGPFENDTAHGFLGDVVRGMRRLIDADLRKARGERIAVFERPIVGAIVLLRAWAARVGAAARLLPKSVVRRWRAEYLAWLDERVLATRTGDEVGWWKAHRRQAQRQFRALLARACGPEDEPSSADEGG